MLGQKTIENRRNNPEPKAGEWVLIVASDLNGSKGEPPAAMMDLLLADCVRTTRIEPLPR